MKGNAQIHDRLNSLLADELTAINSTWSIQKCAQIGVTSDCTRRSRDARSRK